MRTISRTVRVDKQLYDWILNTRVNECYEKGNISKPSISFYLNWLIRLDFDDFGRKSDLVSLAHEYVFRIGVKDNDKEV